MRSASIADWILRRVAGKEQAASMVGDLVEISQHKGIAWFWLCVSRVVLSFVWRPVLGFIASFYAFTWLLHSLDMTVRGMHAQHRPPELWMPFFEILTPASAFAAISFVYSAFRFGLRDPLAQFSLAIGGLSIAICCYWWQPEILAACILLALAFAGISLRNRIRRRAFIAFLCVCAVGIAGGFLALYLESRYQHFVYPGPVGDRELRQHPSILWAGFLAYVLVNLIVTSTCFRLHRWVLGILPSKPEETDTAEHLPNIL
jgi:hypothetical protein